MKVKKQLLEQEQIWWNSLPQKDSYDYIEGGALRLHFFCMSQQYKYILI